jgi:hypothetical protein
MSFLGSKKCPSFDLKVRDFSPLKMNSFSTYYYYPVIVGE